MLIPHPVRRALPVSLWLGVAAFAVACGASRAQSTNATTPAVMPASAEATAPSATATPPPKPVSPRQAREADDAYIEGARHIEKHEYEAAEKSFGKAVQLNPQSSDYLRALSYAREGRVNDLLHLAVAARQSGDLAKAKQLLDQAKTLDPDNSIVAQHLQDGGDVESRVFDPLRFPAENIASTLGDAPALAPDTGKHSLHERGDAQVVLTNVYRAYGIRIQFDAPLTSSAPIRFDLEDADFDTATRLLHRMTKTFAIAVQPKVALVAADTQDNRDRLLPLLEETIYLRGMTNEQMQDLANLARNVFDVKTITASATGGTLLLRADATTMKLLNAEYADMLDGSSDVLLDVHLYEVDESLTRNYGVTTPTSISGFPLATEFQSILNQNQAVLTQAEQAGLLTLGTDQLQNFALEYAFLVAGGYVSSSQLSLIEGILGTIGSYNGIPFIGTSISSGATLNALLQTSDARIIDAVQLRSSDLQKSQFRSGTHYPIETSSYTSGVSSSVSSALSGASTAAQQLAAQYLGGTTSVTIPQITYEDLGLTFTATPQIKRNNDVSLQLELKIESLGGSTLNSIPVLNNRDFTSTVTVPAGKTALLVSSINTSELKSIQGYPGLSELPGFQGGTEKDVTKSSQELLITITPHVVRDPKFRIVSRRLLDPRRAGGGS